MNIEVVKEDIRHIGNTQQGDENGNTCIVCNGETSNIEEILLRSILKCFGDEYKILSSNDFVWNEGEPTEKWGVEFHTNLPFGNTIFF
jgi:hypothetical protein